MSEKKIFRIIGMIRKRKLIRKKEKKEGIEVYKLIVQPFSVEVVAIKPEDALEKIYSNFGSRFKVKRTQIKIEKIEEISPEEAKDPIIQKLFLSINNE